MLKQQSSLEGSLPCLVSVLAVVVVKWLTWIKVFADVPADYFTNSVVSLCVQLFWQVFFSCLFMKHHISFSLLTPPPPLTCLFFSSSPHPFLSFSIPSLLPRPNTMQHSPPTPLSPSHSACVYVYVCVYLYLYMSLYVSLMHPSLSQWIAMFGEVSLSPFLASPSSSSLPSPLMVPVGQATDCIC